MTLFDVQSDDWARGGFQQMASFMRALRKETAENELASKQLQRELEQQVKLENAKPDGVLQSLLYTKLPPEVRHHVYSYLCVVPESIHIYPVKGNSDQGFRLSRCGESRLNDECGWCNCDTPGQTPPAFFETQLLLVSKTVRREALDLLFMHNQFTFTSLYDLTSFSEQFSQTVAKIQNLRVVCRLSDANNSLWPRSGLLSSRQRIGNLQTLTLRCYLDGYKYYETYHEDGFIDEIIPLAFPLAENFSCTVKPRRLWRTEDKLEEIVGRVETKLKDIFTGKYGTDVKNIPMSDPPKKKVPDSEKPPENKRGILALGD